MAVHAWSISYCDAVLSDGFIPNGAWPSKRGFVSGVKEVVAAGLWRLCDGGYQLHDYTDYNRTKAQVLAQREDDRFRKMSGRKPAGHAPDSEGIPRAPGPGPVPGINSRPPARQAGRTAAAGTREPTDFQPLGALLTSDLPDEVLERLGRRPIGQPAVPASPVTLSQETNGALG